jgi:Domain of unknown function (DUF4267)
MASGKLTRNERLILVLCLVGGVLLTVFGIRYFITPEHAARTFGVPDRPLGHELYYIIGLRNVWLGLLAIALAALREWRALALWLSVGAVVCFADAAIAYTSTGRLAQTTFHLVGGFAWIGLASAAWRWSGKQR